MRGNMKRLGFSYLTVLGIAFQFLFSSTGWTQLLNTAHDHVPHFAANPTISSVTNGAWSNPGTWNAARVPGPSDIVNVKHIVIYDSTTGATDVIGIGAGGALRFAINKSTRLSVGTLLVLPNGTLEVGTPSAPIPE
jgi:hypothetical protein